MCAARERERVARLAESLETENPNEVLAATYGRLLARRQRAGVQIGTTDLLIGTAALEGGVPLVTRNRRRAGRPKARAAFPLSEPRDLIR